MAASPIELVALHRDHKGTTQWLEPVMERVRAMAQRWGGDGQNLVDQTWLMYAQRSKALGLWAGLRLGEVVGHALADIRMWDGQAVSWVLQLETDEVVGRAYRDYVLQTLDEWALEAAQALKVTVERHVMSTPRMVDAWARHSGFTPYRILHERPVARRG